MDVLCIFVILEVPTQGVQVVKGSLWVETGAPSLVWEIERFSVEQRVRDGYCG
jgi:hypothetical protein